MQNRSLKNLIKENSIDIPQKEPKKDHGTTGKHILIILDGHMEEGFAKDHKPELIFFSYSLLCGD